MLVKQSVDDFTSSAAEKQIALKLVDPSAALPKVNADKLRIVEGLSNLLANAVNYTPPGGSVTVWLELKNNEVITHITDTGEGIAKEVLPHLFSKFYRGNGKLSQGAKGTGLGLYISKSIVDMHKGKIWVESIQGKGSTFSFSLKAAAQNQFSRETLQPQSGYQMTI